MHEHLCSFAAVGDGAPDLVGETPAGLRITFHVSGGTLTGPRLQGGQARWRRLATVRRSGEDARRGTVFYRGAAVRVAHPRACFGLGEYRKAERTAGYDLYMLT